MDTPGWLLRARQPVFPPSIRGDKATYYCRFIHLCLKSDGFGGFDSIGSLIFLGNKCLQSTTVLVSVNTSDNTAEMFHCRLRLWRQYFKFSSLWNRNSVRKASVLNLCGPLSFWPWPPDLRGEDSVTSTLPPLVDRPSLSPPINGVLLLHGPENRLGFTL